MAASVQSGKWTARLYATLLISAALSGMAYSQDTNYAGGNHYQPQGSIWYFPEAYRND
ncbi:MAG TPA: hypothetical protein VMO78_03725 [Rhizomicrobium sp.]|nr:hypothetical protein [Rhizomicrobium sp.]